MTVEQRAKKIAAFSDQIADMAPTREALVYGMALTQIKEAVLEEREACASGVDLAGGGFRTDTAEGQAGVFATMQAVNVIRLRGKS